MNGQKKEVKEVETMLASRNLTETEELFAFLFTLNPDEKQRFLSFIRGAKFAKEIAQNTAM